MPKRILVTGGTGTLGRVGVQRLLESGAQVRVLSRGRRPAGPTDQAARVVGDVKSGEGLAAAVADVDAVVTCVDPMRHVLDAALKARATPPGVHIDRRDRPDTARLLPTQA